MEIPIIGGDKGLEVELEVPAIFSTKLFFINHQGQYTTVDFALPPGVYPNPKWLDKALEDVYRNSLKALKMSTKDLSWRKCTPQEFVAATAGGQKVTAKPKWAAPYSVEKEFTVPGIEAAEEEDTCQKNNQT